MKKQTCFLFSSLIGGGLIFIWAVTLSAIAPSLSPGVRLGILFGGMVVGAGFILNAKYWGEKAARDEILAERSK